MSAFSHFTLHDCWMLIKLVGAIWLEWTVLAYVAIKLFGGGK